MHKQSCRMLAKHRNDNRIQHPQQAVAATNHNNTNAPSMPTTSNDVDAGHHRWTASMNDMGIIGFGLLGVNESAEVDSSILTAVPPMAVMMGNNDNGIAYNQSNGLANEANPNQIPDTGGTVTGAGIMQNNTSLCMQPQFHHVDQRLLSPQYHQQQQQLMQQQLQCQQMPPTPYAANLTNHNTHHHYEKSISCQIGSGGGVDENAFGNAK